jgi:hypothetical protein
VLDLSVHEPYVFDDVGEHIAAVESPPALLSLRDASSGIAAAVGVKVVC